MRLAALSETGLARQAGLRRGDIILELDGLIASDKEELAAALRNAVGTLRLTVLGPAPDPGDAHRGFRPRLGLPAGLIPGVCCVPAKRHK